MNELGDGIQPKPNKIELFNWDSNGPELEDNVASFTIKDPTRPRTTRNEYCIGYKFLGGDLKNPSNWSYDHTNYWKYDDTDPNEDGEIDPTLVSREKLDEVLAEHSSGASELLAQYCERLKYIK